MTPDESAQFIGRLTMLAELLGEPMTPTRLAGYVGTCDDLDISDLVDALNDCARTCKYFPRPVEIRDRVAEVQHIRARLEMDQERAERLARQELETPAPPRELPAHYVEPEMTPEERAAQSERIATLWAGFREKWLEVAGRKAMPIEPPQTLTQIQAWRRARIAGRPAEGERGGA